MSTVTRTWLGLAALCTGLIHLALVVTSPLPIAAVLLVVGAAEIVWAILAFARDRLPVPRLVLPGALLPLLLWAALVAVATVFRSDESTTDLGFAALGIAALFELFIAVVVGMQLRRGTDLKGQSRMPRPGRYLTGIIAGGLVASALLTPALATTAAGHHAHNHDGHAVLLETGAHTGH